VCGSDGLVAGLTVVNLHPQQLGMGSLSTKRDARRRFTCQALAMHLHGGLLCVHTVGAGPHVSAESCCCSADSCCEPKHGQGIVTSSNQVPSPTMCICICRSCQVRVCWPVLTAPSPLASSGRPWASCSTCRPVYGRGCASSRQQPMAPGGCAPQLTYRSARSSHCQRWVGGGQRVWQG
jgi:hypothetical protein